MKTKTITLKIKVPADYKFIAQESFGEIHLFKKKPVLIKKGQDELYDQATYWAVQSDSISVIGNELMEYNEPKEFEKTLKKI